MNVENVIRLKRIRKIFNFSVQSLMFSHNRNKKSITFSKDGGRDRERSPVNVQSY